MPLKQMPPPEPMLEPAQKPQQADSLEPALLPWQFQPTSIPRRKPREYSQ